MKAHMKTMTVEYDFVQALTPIDLCFSGNGMEEQSDDNANGGDDVYNDDNYVNAYNGDDAYNATAYNADDAYTTGDDAYNGDDSYKSNNAYNGDDTYNTTNDSEQCPQDGVYAFTQSFDIPKSGRMWRSTGWKAHADVKLFTEDGTLIGSCKLAFETRASFGMSAKSFSIFWFAVLSLALFVGVAIGIRRGNGCKCFDCTKAFRSMGDELATQCAEACAYALDDNKQTKKDEDLDITYDSDSTHSLTDILGDKLNTTSSTSSTPSPQAPSRPSPIKVMKILGTIRSSPNPPPSPLASPIMDHDDIESNVARSPSNPPTTVRTLFRDESFQSMSPAAPLTSLPSPTREGDVESTYYIPPPSPLPRRLV